MKLPLDFEMRMKTLLPQEKGAFLDTYKNPPTKGLRINPLKASPEEIRAKLPFSLRPILWSPLGFYYEENQSPGKSPYHEAGAYYIQEPSAMAAAEALSPKPGEKILDLCASPGGKTTHIASYMAGEGLLVANEIHPQRARILSQNVERMGVRNALVLNETPAKLAACWPGFFDKILVDAPCSGEGMFRKNPEAMAEWSLDNVLLCQERQKEILIQAEKMLKKDGLLVYATCTFSQEENEEILAWFLERYPYFEMEASFLSSYFSPGFTQKGEFLSRALRIFPHQVEGEGHFIGVLRKRAHTVAAARQTEKEASVPPSFRAFEAESLGIRLEGHFLDFKGHLYFLNTSFPLLKGLRVLRPGLYLGEVKKALFFPSHSLFTALLPKEAQYTWALDEREAALYMGGEALAGPGQKGWHLVHLKGISLGLGKWNQGLLKNHYPKGLRIRNPYGII